MKASAVKLIWIVLIGLLVIGAMLTGGILLTRHRSERFQASGYLLDTVNADGAVELVTTEFSAGSGYRENAAGQIVFSELSGQQNARSRESFVHYSDESVSAFSEGVLLDMEQLNAGLLNYYMVPAEAVLARQGEGYMIDNNGYALEFFHTTYKISQHKYLMLSDTLQFTLPGGTVETLADYYDPLPDEIRINGIWQQEHTGATESDYYIKHFYDELVPQTFNEDHRPTVRTVEDTANAKQYLAFKKILVAAETIQTAAGGKVHPVANYYGDATDLMDRSAAMSDPLAYGHMNNLFVFASTKLVRGQEMLFAGELPLLQHKAEEGSSYARNNVMGAQLAYSYGDDSGDPDQPYADTEKISESEFWARFLGLLPDVRSGAKLGDADQTAYWKYFWLNGEEETAFMPYLVGVANQNGFLSQGNYAQPNPMPDENDTLLFQTKGEGSYTGSIPVPAGGMQARTFGLGAEALPEVTAYAAGAAVLNLEFHNGAIPYGDPDFYGNTWFTVMLDGKEVALTPAEGAAKALVPCEFTDAEGNLHTGYYADDRVYSFLYDFQSDITVTTWAEDVAAAGTLHSKSFAFEAAELARRVDTWAEEYGYIGNSGRIQGSLGEIAPPAGAAKFVNLYHGEALTDTGMTVQLQSGSTEAAAAVGALTQLAQPRPLFTGRYNGYEIAAFAGFSATKQEGLCYEVDRQLFVRNNVLFTNHGAGGAYAPAGLIADTYGARSYLTLLNTGNGALESKAEVITVPQGFANADILQISNTLANGTRNHNVLGVRGDGSVFGFNYITGEALEIGEDGKANISFGKYLLKQVKMRLASFEEPVVNEEFRQKTLLADEIEVYLLENPEVLPEHSGVGDVGITEQQPGTEGGDQLTTDQAADHTETPSDGTEEVYGPGEEEPGAAEGQPAEPAGEAGAAEQGQAGGGSADSAAGTGASTSPGEPERTGADIVVAVRGGKEEAEAEQYAVYAAEDLLTKQSDALQPLEEQLEERGVHLGETGAGPDTGAAVKQEKTGLETYLLLSAGIVVLLGVLMGIRKRREKR